MNAMRLPRRLPFLLVLMIMMATATNALSTTNQMNVKNMRRTLSAPQPASRSRLFTNQRILSEKTNLCRKEKSLRIKNQGILTALSWVLLGVRPALATTTATASSIFSHSPKHYLKLLLCSVAFFVTVTSAYATLQTHKRQALDATSEWTRYANHPAARGRAVMMICLRIFPYWVRQRLARSATAKSRLQTQSGAIFADSLLQLGPLYIKLGQILSCREHLLPPEWITAMERLQDKVPARSGDEALALAHAAMGDQFHAIFSDFDTTPLAAASLGQVHKAVLRDSNETVAVKLQRPKLRDIYNQDLQLLTKIASTVDGMRRGGGGVSWTDIFADAKEILYREIDYRAEADNGARFNADFGLAKGGVAVTPTSTSLDGEALPSAASWLRAPHVYRNVSSEQVLVMEFVPSIKITHPAVVDGVSWEHREFLADSLARSYLRSFCVNRFFSTDPHPGNLGVELMGDGQQPPRLVMYDFGQACELQADQAEGILDVIEAIVDMDSDRCVDAFAKMGVLKENADLIKVRAKVQDNFETGKVTVKRKKLKKAGYKFKEKKEAEVSTTDDDDITKVKDTEVIGFFTLPAEYAFVARALSQMDGVGKTLDPDFDFISSAAPNIVEIKGAGNYLKDEWTKWVKGVEKQVFHWQEPSSVEEEV